MFITPHKDGHRVQVQKHGMRASKVLPTKRAATAWGLAKEAEFESLKGSKGRTLAQAVTKYVATVSSTKAGDAEAWEQRRFDAMMEFFGPAAHMVAIDSARIGEWRDFRLTGDADHKPVSGSTVQRESNLLRNLFTIACDEWRWIDRNPFKGVRLPDHNPARRQMWTWQLIKRVLRAPRTGKTLQMIHAFHIALNTGMRESEVLAAKVVGKVAILPKAKGVLEPVKVPLARHGADLLKKYTTGENGKHQPFTVGANEGSVLFSDLLDELLIDDLTFHDSRGSALTWLSRRVDVMTLARISRHKDIRILMDTYYRETAEQIAARL